MYANNGLLWQCQSTVLCRISLNSWRNLWSLRYDSWYFRWGARTLGIWWTFAGPHSYEAVDVRWEHICLPLWFGLCVALVTLSICHWCWPRGCHPCYWKVTFRLIPPPSQPHFSSPSPWTLRRGRLRDVFIWGSLYDGGEAAFPVPSRCLNFTACGPSVHGLWWLHSSLTWSQFFTLKC